MSITGRVQYVGFRWFAERAASRHGVHGHVRNISDGSVVVFAQATRQSLEAFRGDLREGPHAAYVDDIQVTQVRTDSSLIGFEIRF